MSGPTTRMIVSCNRPQSSLSLCSSRRRIEMKRERGKKERTGDEGLPVRIEEQPSCDTEGAGA